MLRIQTDQMAFMAEFDNDEAIRERFPEYRVLPQTHVEAAKRKLVVHIGQLVVSCTCPCTIQVGEVTAICGDPDQKGS